LMSTPISRRFLICLDDCLVDRRKDTTNELQIVVFITGVSIFQNFILFKRISLSMNI